MIQNSIQTLRRCGNGRLATYLQALVRNKLGEALGSNEGMVDNKVLRACVELEAVVYPGPKGDGTAAPVHIIKNIIKQCPRERDTGDTACQNAAP